MKGQNCPGKTDIHMSQWTERPMIVAAKFNLQILRHSCLCLSTHGQYLTHQDQTQMPRSNTCFRDVLYPILWSLVKIGCQHWGSGWVDYLMGLSLSLLGEKTYRKWFEHVGHRPKSSDSISRVMVKQNQVFLQNFEWRKNVPEKWPSSTVQISKLNSLDNVVSLDSCTKPLIVHSRCVDLVHIITYRGPVCRSKCVPV